MTDAIGRGTNRGKDLEDRARAIVELEKAKAGLTVQLKAAKEQIAGKYKDAEGAGHPKKLLAKCVRELAMDSGERDLFYEAERAEQEQLDQYRHALGLADTDAGRKADLKVLAAEIDAAAGTSLGATLVEGEELERRIREKVRKGTKHEERAR